MGINSTHLTHGERKRMQEYAFLTSITCRAFSRQWR